MRLLLLACLCCGLLVAADDLDRLVDEAKLPPVWASHQPAFTVATETFLQATADGEKTKDFLVIRDAGKAVAVLDEGACQLDWITAQPDKASADLVLPRVYSWVSLLGCRISTVAWIDQQGASGETRTHVFSGGGPTITLTVEEAWTSKRQGESRYSMTLRLDPQLGYVWDLQTRISVDRLAQRNGKPQRDVELFNIQPGRISDPWPDRARFDLTLVSPPKETGFLGFANNLVAGDRSDNNGRLAMRDGGMNAFIADRDGWGIALTRRTDAEQSPNATCNVWMDQHNKLLFPGQPDAQGRHVISASWRWVGLPPAVVAVMRAQTRMISFGEKAVMLRLGRSEDFDDQPLDLATTERGLWTWGMAVDGAHARSGTKALLVGGTEKLDGNSGRFIAPFVPLDGSAAYRLEAWVWLEGGEDARFFICSGEAKAEEGPMRHRSTNRISPKPEWQRVSWDITKRGNLDLRIITLGKGAKAWVDDFSLMKQP
ncbi:MAG TPA: hypothetical protein DCS97_10280 [Planctomycetes bacterium]|nr:hypothetical protein [Planctomycetota bacterium]